MASKYPHNYGGAVVLGDENAKVVMEAFVDLVCPFSKRAFGKFASIVAAVPSAQIRVYVYVQPWHAQSSLLAKAALTVDSWKAGAGPAMIAAIYEHQDEYKDDPVADKTPNDVFESLAQLAQGVGMPREDFLTAVKSDETVKRVKFATKYGRQNSIHVTPTFMLQGLVFNEASSSWTVEQFVEVLAAVQGE